MSANQAAETCKDLIRALKDRPEIQEASPTIIMAGDSICVACIFNPKLQIRNTLLRSAVNNTLQRCREIIEMLSKAKIVLTWMKGTVNAADAVSKLHFNEVDLINSDLYRHRPPDWKAIDGIKQVPFYQMTKDKEEFIPLPHELITKAKEQERKIQELDPERTLSNKIENSLCICEIPEECGIFLTTRAMTNKGKDVVPWRTRSCIGTGMTCRHEENDANDAPDVKRTIAGKTYTGPAKERRIAGEAMKSGTVRGMERQLLKGSMNQLG